MQRPETTTKSAPTHPRICVSGFEGVQEGGLERGRQILERRRGAFAGAIRTRIRTVGKVTGGDALLEGRRVAVARVDARKGMRALHQQLEDQDAQREQV